jgi:hypothetical protein
MMTNLSHRFLVAALAFAAAGAGPAAFPSGVAHATPLYTVTFDDPDAAHSAYYSAISTDLTAAGADWARHLAGSGTIGVQVRFAAIPTANGTSAASAYVGQDGATAVYDQGAAAKLRTGVDPNGAAPDAIITIGDSYLRNQLWFDSQPTAGGPVPSGKIDAFSVFLHELGHVFGFNGFRDPTTGQLPGAYESTFDRFVTVRPDGIYFTGEHALAAYGGPVPLTAGNYTHFGNASPGAGSDLIGDLMNGVSFWYGYRYEISPLDLAVMSDIGVPLIPDANGLSGPVLADAAAPDPAVAVIPEPPTITLLLAAIAAFAMIARGGGGSGLRPLARGARIG